MTEIILHVFDVLSGAELPASEHGTKGTRSFSFITDRILSDKDFIIGGTKDAPVYDPTMAARKAKTQGQDFKDRQVELRARAQIEAGCSINHCHWCLDCYNKVAAVVGAATI